MRQGHSQWCDALRGGTLSDMKSLTRSSTDRKVGGVSAGLAQYFNVDPILFRVGFVAGTLATGGAGVIAYLGFLVFVPSDDAVPTYAATA